MKHLERIFDLLNMTETSIYRGDTNKAIDALQTAKFELAEWTKVLTVNPKPKQRGNDDPKD